MKKLKTLKDLKTIKTWETNKPDNIWFNVELNELQDMAKEWIKHLEKKPAYVKKWEKRHEELENIDSDSASSESACLSMGISRWKYSPIRLAKIELIKEMFNLD